MMHRIFNMQLMTIKEVSEYFQINRCTVYDWRKRGILKAYGIGRKVYFKADEVRSVLIELKRSGK
ncbi:helix-turn-helix domain-containing protein [Labilibacter sediminis]|nr:helix-turn-helix domain-containing protein [Labilibacter sediminis]